jgi:hypothetical protein
MFVFLRDLNGRRDVIPSLDLRTKIGDLLIEQRDFRSLSNATDHFICDMLRNTIIIVMWKAPKRGFADAPLCSERYCLSLYSASLWAKNIY